MAEMTSCFFLVSDPNGGAQDRPFTFSSIQRGTDYIVTITFDGGLHVVTLSQTNPTVELPDLPKNRVKPFPGTLQLAWDTSSPAAMIQFDGTLVTNAPVSMKHVVVASFD